MPEPDISDALTPTVTLPKQVRGNVRVFHGPRGRGLQTTAAVAKGELLIGIPKKWAIDVSASQSGGTAGQIALCCELAKLRRQNDFRVKHLPESCDMPAFWSEAQLQWLAGSYAHEPASSQRKTLESLHANMKPPCSLDEFIWGMCMVQSRTFGGDGVMVFLPFIDLLNSSFEPTLDFDVRRADGYINIHASRDFEKGEEALVSYHGRRAPGLYTEFLAYGYVPQEGVEYPQLFPWNDTTPEPALQGLLERWTKHMQAVSSKGLPVAEDIESYAAAQGGGGSDAARLSVARNILQHEKRMAVEQAVAIKKRLAAMKK